MLAFLLLFVAGCGEEDVGEGAVVSVYAEAPLCEGAERELQRRDGRAGEVGARLICLEEAGGRWRIAAIAAGARRAAEDSTAVAYLGSRNRRAIRFSAPILDEAGIPRISASSGRRAMSQALDAREGPPAPRRSP